MALILAGEGHGNCFSWSNEFPGMLVNRFGGLGRAGAKHFPILRDLSLQLDWEYEFFPQSMFRTRDKNLPRPWGAENSVMFNIRKWVTETSGQGRMAGGRREVLSLRANTWLCAEGTGQTLLLKDGEIMAKRCFHDRFWCQWYWCTRQRCGVRLKEKCSDLWSTAGALVKLKITKRRLTMLMPNRRFYRHISRLDDTSRLNGISKLGHFLDATVKQRTWVLHRAVQ